MDVGTDCPSEPVQPLTVLVNQFVRRDKRHIFANWCREINLIAQNFEGFISTEVIRPATDSTIHSATTTTTATAIPNNNEVDEFIAIVRFDNYSNLQRWMTSNERSNMMERVEEFSDKVPIFSYNSIEHWFTSTGTTSTAMGSTSNQNNGPPAKYKMWLVTCVVIYLQVLWVPKLTDLILPVQKINPNILKFINTVLTVTFSTFIFFPIVTRLLSFWLFPHSNYTEKLLELIPLRKTMIALWSSLVSSTTAMVNDHETSRLIHK
jgi:antibiotic biosynthesis monooxygenase (ABM) superfamily enzyme